MQIQMLIQMLMHTKLCTIFTHTIHIISYPLVFGYTWKINTSSKRLKKCVLITSQIDHGPKLDTIFRWMCGGYIWVNDITTEPCSPEPWKSWELDSGNHPQMAQQFRLVKYYFIYPEYMILWYLQLDGTRVTNLRLPWAVLWWFSVELAEFPVFEKIPLTSWNGSKLQGDIGFILES
jgi:hypothetical protein